MKQTLRSKYGTIRLNKKNHRVITDEAFDGLKKSLMRDPCFLRLDRLIVDENGVTLGGNQRFKAFLRFREERIWEWLDGETDEKKKRQWHKTWDWLNSTDPKIPDEWVVKAEHEDGSNLTKEEKDRLALIDNSPEGISGTNDYAAMVEGFSLDLLRDVGIDLAKIELPEETREEFEGKAAEEIETESPIGEESETLKDLHRKRDESKKKFEDMADFGFYAVLVFMTNDQRKAFGKWCADHDVRAKYSGMYVNGEDFAQAVKIKLPKDTGAAIRERLPNAVLESMTLDGGRSPDEDETQNQEEITE